MTFEECFTCESEPVKTIRFKGSRIALDIIVEAWLDGTLPAELEFGYSRSLSAEQIGFALEYYRANRDEIDTYMAAREEFGERAMAELERKNPTAALRERMQRKLASRETVSP